MSRHAKFPFPKSESISCAQRRSSARHQVAGRVARADQDGGRVPVDLDQVQVSSWVLALSRDAVLAQLALMVVAVAVAVSVAVWAAVAAVLVVGVVEVE